MEEAIQYLKAQADFHIKKADQFLKAIEALKEVEPAHIEIVIPEEAKNKLPFDNKFKNGDRVRFTDWARTNLKTSKNRHKWGTVMSYSPTKENFVYVEFDGSTVRNGFKEDLLQLV